MHVMYPEIDAGRVVHSSYKTTECMTDMSVMTKPERVSVDSILLSRPWIMPRFSIKVSIKGCLSRGLYSFDLIRLALTR